MKRILVLIVGLLCVLNISGCILEPVLYFGSYAPEQPKIKYGEFPFELIYEMKARR